MLRRVRPRIAHEATPADDPSLAAHCSTVVQGPSWLRPRRRSSTELRSFGDEHGHRNRPIPGMDHSRRALSQPDCHPEQWCLRSGARGPRLEVQHDPQGIVHIDDIVVNDRGIGTPYWTLVLGCEGHDGEHPIRRRWSGLHNMIGCS